MALVVCPVIPLCVVTTRLAAATDILRLRRAIGYLGSSRGSSCGSSRRSSSTTSPTPHDRVPRHVTRLVTRLVVDCYTYAACPGASAPRVARRTARTRLVVDYFTYAARPAVSARRAARRRPRVVSPLNFSSVGCTGSRRVPSYSASRLDYSSFGLHRLYCAYVVHPDASSRRSTSRRSVALALAVRPVTASHGVTTSRPDCTGSTAPMPCIRTRRLDASTSHRSVALALAMRLVTTSGGATTHRPDCTGSTAPMSCIWTRRLDARFLVSRSQWLLPCARSFRCAS
jgi:hypothetical protein